MLKWDLPADKNVITVPFEWHLVKVMCREWC